MRVRRRVDVIGLLVTAQDIVLPNGEDVSTRRDFRPLLFESVFGRTSSPFPDTVVFHSSRTAEVLQQPSHSAEARFGDGV